MPTDSPTAAFGKSIVAGLAATLAVSILSGATLGIIDGRVQLLRSL